MKIRNIIPIILTLIIGINISYAQSIDVVLPASAFKNVIIHTTPGKVMEDGVVVWRNGVIEYVGTKESAIPFDAYVFDGGDSLHIYAGFIDGLGWWGSPDVPKKVVKPKDPGHPSYERAGIQPERMVADAYDPRSSTYKKAQELGFTVLNLGIKGYMLPGQSSLYFNYGHDLSDALYKPSTSYIAQLKPAAGTWSTRAYPNTVMGVMARFRQLFYDAEALRDHIAYYNTHPSSYPAPHYDKVIEAFIPVTNGHPVFFVEDSRENIERVSWLQNDLGFKWVLVSANEGAERVSLLKNKRVDVLANIHLPKKPEWYQSEKESSEDKKEDKKEESSGDKKNMKEDKKKEVSEEERMYREQRKKAYEKAINNIKEMFKSKLNVGYASNNMDMKLFKENLNILRDHGLEDNHILSMLTVNTASILQLDNVLGKVEKGFLACFNVFNKPFFEKESKVVYSISNGKVTEMSKVKD